MKPVIIRGAGLIGQLVAEKLIRKNIPVTIISRNPQRFGAKSGFTVLNRADIPAQVEAAKNAAAIINLEGKNIAGVWTKKIKTEIAVMKMCSSPAI